MSTVLINTNGGSTFQESTDFINTGDNDNLLRELGITLTNTDQRPILKPNRKVIDVVNDFSWYAGPKATPAALNKVPCVFLQEREQLLSSLVSGALYYLNASSRSISDVLQSDSIKSLLGTVMTEENADSLQGSVADTFQSLEAVLGGTASDQDLLKHHNLKSLKGIYFTKPTGFYYRLPQYENQLGVQNSSAEGSDGNSIVVDAVTSAQGFIEDIASVVNLTQPGTYIEKPQYFNNPSTYSKTVTFPLANTIRRGNVSPIQQNYELLWLLAFQNRPYKTSFTRTPPPKIYTVSVPGQYSMPYAYISNMSVDFVGTVRKTSVVVPSGNGEGTIGSKVVQTPVPEAYQVSIEFSSLISDYGNQMISDAFNTSINDNIVRIGR